MSHQLADVLRGIYGLENASEEGLMALGAKSSYLVWEQDGLIFDVGDPSEGIFIIVAGRVEITEPDGSLVAQLESGIFGEISAIFNTAHTKAARATERSELVFVPSVALDAHLEKHPDQAERLRELVQTRLAGK